MSDSIVKKPANIYRKSSTPSERPCLIAKECGACLYINQNYQQSLQDKWQKGLSVLWQHNLERGVQVIPPEPALKTFGYRTHAKLAIRAQKGPERFRIGLFKPGTHEVVDIRNCPLHKPNINRFIRDLAESLEESSLTPYDEATGFGDLRYVAVRSSHHTDELMVTFVVTHDQVKTTLKNMLQELKGKGHKIPSAHLNINAESTNVIFSKESKHLLGSDRLREGLAGLNFEIGPTSFFQVNPWEAERIYRRIEQLAGFESKNEVAWDLYCGIGQIAMILARLGYRVLGIEMNPQATRDAQRNAARNMEQPPYFETGRVEDQIEGLPSWAKSPRLIVTNPARKGLDEKVRQVLKTLFQEQPGLELMYVSCAVESLARDLEDLVKGSPARLRQIEAFDMFPHTDKMEWLAILN